MHARTARRRSSPKFRRTCAALLIAGILLGGTGFPARATEARSMSRTAVTDEYAALAATDQRVIATGYRLLAAATPWCPVTQPLPGWALTDRRQYPASEQHAAGSAYGADWGAAAGAGDVIVSAIAPDGPAARAGLRVGEAISRIDGVDLSTLGDRATADSYARMAAINAAMPGWLADGALDLTLANGTTRRVVGPAACAAGFSLKPGKRMNAWTDGRTVQLTDRLATYASDDAELAALLAHELAHVILRHPAALKERGVKKGLLTDLGIGAGYTRETERAADRLSLWIMARAGFDPVAAGRFWRRFGPAYAGGPFRAATHDGWRDRARMLDMEAQAAMTALAADRNARPPELPAITEGNAQ